MTLAKVQAIIGRLRSAGFTVHEWPGWQTRSNGYAPAYEGGLIHHTATNYGSAYQGLVTGRTDLAGPLCNFAGNQDGSLTVISAGPANHAGASGGRSMGPLPVTKLFNPRVLGLEIVYPGTAPMTAAQYRSACAWARVVADVVGGGDIQRVRAHAETSITGKWDPGYANGKTIDMTKFRADAAQALQQQGETEVEPGTIVKLYPEFVTDYNEPQRFDVALGKIYFWLANVKKEQIPGIEASVKALTAEVAAIKAAQTAPVPVEVDYDRIISGVVGKLAGNTAFLGAVATAVNNEFARRQAA